MTHQWILGFFVVAQVGCAGPEISRGGDDPSPSGTPSPLPSPPPDATDAVFDLSILHEVSITVDPQYLAVLDGDTGERVPCDVTFDGVTVTNAGIKRKGASTISPLSGKPSLSIKFNHFVPGQKLLGLKKLILNNSILDGTFSNEHIGYEAYRQAGLPGPRTAHAIVTLNGFTYGVYVVKEAVDKQFLARTFGAGNEEGNLYEGGGDFVGLAGEPALKDEVEENRSRADFDALKELVINTPDDQWEQQVSTRLDLNQYLSTYAVDAVAGHFEGYSLQLTNFYMYNHPADSRFVFLPHGMDLLGFVGDPYEATGPALLAQKVRQIPTLDARYRAEVTRVLEGWDVPALLARVDQVGVVLHSTSRTDARTLADLDSYDNNSGPLIRQFIESRKTFLATP